MTAAEHIRQLADAMGYWTSPPERQTDVRKRIMQAEPTYTRQAIELALKRGSKPGKPANPRCPHCGQRMPTKTNARARRKVA